MSWFRFMKVDMRLLKKQLPFLIVFPAFVLLIAASGTDMFFIVSYLCFGVLVLSATPFLTEDRSMSAFIQFLPGTDRDKIIGRYAWFLAMLVVFSLFGFAVSYMMHHLGIGEVRVGKDEVYFCMAAILFSMIIGFVQTAVFYSLGRVRSQQWFNIIRLLPAFVFFFGTNYVTEHIASIGNSSIEKVSMVSGEQDELLRLVMYLYSNRESVLLAGVAAAVIILIICIAVSNYFVSRRDVNPC